MRGMSPVFIGCALLVSSCATTTVPQAVDPPPPEERWQTLLESGERYAGAGLFRESEPKLEQALAIAETFGERDERYEASVFALGRTYRALGRIDESEQLLQRSLALRLDRYGPGSLQLAAVLNILSVLYMDTRDFDRSFAMAERALAIRVHHGLTTEYLLSDMHNLAEVQRLRGNLEDAKTAFRQLIAAALRLQTKRSRQHAVISMDRLGLVYRDLGQLDEARDILERSLRISAESTGPRNVNIGLFKRDLATVLHAQGQRGEAADAYEEALPLLRRFLGTRSRVTREATREYADLLEEMGDVARARDLRAGAAPQNGRAGTR